MKRSDIALLMAAISPVLREYVQQAEDRIAARIADVEKRVSAELPALLELRKELEAGIGEVVEGLPGQINKFVDEAIAGEAATVCRLARTEIAAYDKDMGGAVATDLVASVVEAEVARQIKELPTPRDGAPGERGEPGKDGIDGKDGKNGAPGENGEKGDAGEPGRDGVDGKDGAAGERGEKGESGDRGEKGEPGAPGRDGTDGKDGAKGVDGINGKDGVGLAGAIIDHAGELVVTMTDGTTHRLGQVVGKDGAPGRDGFSLEDFSATYDGERTVTLAFAPGTGAAKEFKFVLPVVLDRGVFKDGTEYGPGDAVSFGGSLWIARAVTKDKPGTSDAFRLAVKKGRDGKDGEAPRPPATVKLK